MNWTIENKHQNQMYTDWCVADWGPSNQSRVPPVRSINQYLSRWLRNFTFSVQCLIDIARSWHECFKLNPLGFCFVHVEMKIKTFYRNVAQKNQTNQNQTMKPTVQSIEWERERDMDGKQVTKTKAYERYMDQKWTTSRQRRIEIFWVTTYSLLN